MPTYDYQCQECKKIYEVNHSIKDNAFKKYLCPKCKKETNCKRVMSVENFGVYFSGYGFIYGTTKQGSKGRKLSNVRSEEDLYAD